MVIVSSIQPVVIKESVLIFYNYTYFLKSTRLDKYKVQTFGFVLKISPIVFRKSLRLNLANLSD